MNNRNLRFLLALVLCVLFVGSSSDDDWCDSDSKEQGTILAQNHSTVRVYVTISGPTDHGFLLNGGYQSYRTCDTGSYTVTGVVDQYGSPFDGQQIYSRSFSLSKDETETCSMDF